jgi:hypothetical protein
MMSTYISVALRKRVTKLAVHRCGYCLRTEELMGMPMTIEQITISLIIIDIILNGIQFSITMN